MKLSFKTSARCLSTRFATALLVLVVATTGLAGCSHISRGGGVKYEELHGPFAGQVTAMHISRAKLDQAVSRGASLNALRMVEVFRRADEAGPNMTPQYRLFDIQPGSVYDLVGLKTNDILLAADGLVVFDPLGFKAYVTTVLRAVPDGRVSEIFISRLGVPMRLQITTVP